jgi:hypothetical protein
MVRHRKKHHKKVSSRKGRARRIFKGQENLWSEFYRKTVGAV